MTVRIFRPAKTAMSSGVANTKLWVLEYSPSSAREVDPLMGWTSSGDMQSQIRLNFASKEAAVEYAKSKGLHFIISDHKSGAQIFVKEVTVKTLRQIEEVYGLIRTNFLV